MRCTRTRMRSTECTYLQSCLPARLSFLSKPDTEFGPKQKRRETGHQSEGQTTRRSRERGMDQSPRCSHRGARSSQTAEALHLVGCRLSLSKSIGRLVGHGRGRLAVSQHSDQAGCERIRPSMQVAVDGRRTFTFKSRSLHSHRSGSPPRPISKLCT